MDGQINYFGEYVESEDYVFQDFDDEPADNEEIEIIVKINGNGIDCNLPHFEYQDLPYGTFIAKIQYKKDDTIMLTETDGDLYANLVKMSKIPENTKSARTAY